VYRTFSILVSLIFALAAGCLFFMQKNEIAGMNAIFNSVQKTESVQIENLVKQEESRLVTFTNEYSYGDTAVQNVSQSGTRTWDPEHLDAALPLYDVDCVMLLDTRYDQVASIKSSDWPDTTTVVNESSFILQELRDSMRASVFGHFYAASASNTLWEVAYAPVQPSSDVRRVTAPRGYIVSLRKWDANLCRELGSRARSDFKVIFAGQHIPIEKNKWTDGNYKVEHSFFNRNGDNIAFLLQTVEVPALKNVGMFYTNGAVLIFGCLLALYLCTIAIGYLLIGNRLRKLMKVLRIGDTSAIENVKNSDSEYGMLARAVEFAYMQRNSEQTASLGRDTAEGKLAQREKFLSTILRNLNGAVLVISHDGILTLAEGRDLDSYGIMKDRDVNRPITNILRGQDRLVQFETALQGKRSSLEQRVGERVFLTMCEPLLAKDGKTDNVVVLALDVSEKRQVEETLTRAKLEAERADKIKTQFLSVMSHETRTPLNGVLGFASVLRETPLNEEQRSYLDRIVESGQNLLRLLTDILDLARLEAGEDKKNLEPVSLQALVYQFAERYRLACKNKSHLEFDLDIDQRLPDYVESDNEMLSRILSSILDNAVKFTNTGKVKFSVAWVAKDKEGKSGVQFVVADTGPGISPDMARNIFDPFHQGDSSNTREHGGLGLGLTIAHRLAKLLDGRLTFETKVDVGTTFTFFLPTKALNDSAARTSQMRD
jgi:signal transduction histidine kinase